MKLPAHCFVAPEKLTRYLLVNRARNDKSGFLARAGYGAGNWEVLSRDLLRLAAMTEAQWIETNKFGTYYAVSDRLRGPNGRAIAVRTFWMTEHLSKVTKFITLIPDDAP